VTPKNAALTTRMPLSLLCAFSLRLKYLEKVKAGCRIQTLRSLDAF
jgi:hypothetical protein